jgi:hypothetical protein
MTLTVADRRQRGTTGQTSESRTRKVESKLIEEAERRGPSAVLRRAPLLCDLHRGFWSGWIMLDIWLRSRAVTTAWGGIKFARRR